MQEFRLKKTGIKVVDLDGGEHILRRPTVLEVAELSESKKTDSAKDTVDATLNWLEKMGLPKKVSESMEIDDLLSLVELLSAKKK